MTSKTPTKLLSAGAAREVRKNTLLRQARTCYDHLAGVAGVTLMQEMLERGWFKPLDTGKRPNYALTEIGRIALLKRQVDIEDVRRTQRKFAYGCPDWTEQQPHLGGALGTAILHSLMQQGYIKRHPDTREVQIVKPLAGWLKET